MTGEFALVGFGDDLVADREPDSGAFANRLGCEEGIKNMRSYLL